MRKIALWTVAALLSGVPVARAQFLPPNGMSLDSRVGSKNGPSLFDSQGNLNIPVTGSIANAPLSPTMTGAQAATAITNNAAAIVTETNRATAAEQANAAAAANAIPLAQKGAANGVAALDASSQLTNAINTGGIRLGNWQPSTGVDPYSWGYESNIFGGMTQIGSNYQPQQLFIQADPYAGYAPGCGLGVAMTGSVYASQFPVNQAVPTDGASSVVGGTFDSVADCALVSNRPARLILTATGYTATSVTLATALTAAQAAQIHPNMYIFTNSPNPTLTPPTTTGTLPAKNLYAGYVSAAPVAGDTSISVFAWDIPGYGSGAAGQVPQTATLDTAWSAYPTPTVFLGGGAGGAAFAHNWFFNVNVPDLTPSATTKSFIRQLTPLEVDLNFVNGTAPANSIWWQGISMNAGNQPAALTKDSRQVFLGGNINHHLLINGGCGNWDYEGISSGGAVYMPTQCGITSTAPAQEAQEWGQFISGANTVRTILWNQLGNTTAPVGWQQDVVHLGPMVDGAPAQTGAPSGTPQGDIEWNQGGNYGGISLCGYGTNCNFVVNGNGTPFAYPTGLPSGTNGLVIGAQPSGYVAALGVYAPSGDTNNLVDIETGNISEFLVDASGNGTFKGTVNAGGANFTAISFTVAPVQSDTSTAIPTTAWVKTWGANTYAPNTAVVSAKTANYTLTTADCGGMITDVGATAAHTITVPASVVAPGCRIDIYQTTANTVTIAAGAGETLSSVSGALTLSGAGAHARIDTLSATLASVHP